MKTCTSPSRREPVVSLGVRASLILALVTCATLCVAAEPQDLPPIFNGRDLTGWQVPDPNPFWTVTEARWTGEIDSGIMLRHPELQLQIGISRSLKRDMTCSFYTNGQEKYPEAGQAKNLAAYLKPGDWNKIRLQAKGNTFTAWLNGQKMVEYTDSRYPDPYAIGLQIHPGLKMKIEFRNIRLKDLDAQN